MNDKKLVIIKAGGTSVGGIDQGSQVFENHIKISKILERFDKENKSIILVNSAFAKLTRFLDTVSSDLKDKYTSAYHENLALGELFTAKVLNNNLKGMGFKTSLMNEEDFPHPVSLRKNGTGLKISNINTLDIYRELESNNLPIIPGFVGRIHGGWGTISFDGSDITAVIIGIFFKKETFYNHEEVALIKDYAIYDKDPKLPNAKHIPKLNWDEAIALTETCGNFVHPNAIKIAKENQLPIRIITFDGQESIIGN